MARTFTASALETIIRQRSDIGLSTTGYVTGGVGSEMYSYINASLAELWGLLVDSFGENWACNVANITPVANQTIYTLPSDFYKMQAVDVYVDATLTRTVTVLPYMNSERNKFSNLVATAYTGLWYTNLRYRVISYGSTMTPGTTPLTQSIEFIPSTGPNPLTAKITYNVCAPTLVNTTDSVDFINGWEEYVITDCILKIKAKAEADLQFEMNAKNMLIDRIRRESRNRDAGEPRYIVDRYQDGTNGGGPWGSGFGPF